MAAVELEKLIGLLAESPDDKALDALFWAPLDTLPALRSSQAAWLSMLMPPV